MFMIIKVDGKRLMKIYEKVKEEIENGTTFYSKTTTDDFFKHYEFHEYKISIGNEENKLEIECYGNNVQKKELSVSNIRLNDYDVKAIDLEGDEAMKLLFKLFENANRKKENNFIDSVLNDNIIENETNIKLNKWEIRFLMDLYKKTKDCSIIWSEDANDIYDKLEDGLKRL